MHKMVGPLIGITVASFFALRAAMNMVDPLAVQPTAPSRNSRATPPVVTTSGGQLPQEAVHKAVIRCMSDMDDLLDTIHDSASFARVRPKLLSRAQLQKNSASAYPGQGMVQLSRAQRLEMQQAVNRHTASLARACQVVPAVREFFEKDIAAILNAP
jgi:hypothetical protein